MCILNKSYMRQIILLIHRKLKKEIVHIDCKGGKIERRIYIEIKLNTRCTINQWLILFNYGKYATDLNT
jgi:hypothetical protein